ncbi:Polyketide synthase [Metarhizium humberi]|uniref:Polyketide synthase n=1 Tax=Metarhizium humberi TaxID=2596975 RepID=A0A9P8MDM6_9HYPO|nr:Polyketide synthase [Metarhizium humberi]
MDATPDSAKPVAIIGMGFRLPGGISTDAQYWDLLINKKNGRCRVPATRYNVDGFSGGKTQTQFLATEYGYFLQTELSNIDPSFFSMKPADATVLDPQLRLLLEVAWECMESAGQTHKLVGSDTGVFVGVFGEDWHNMLHRDDLMPNTHRLLSAGDYALSNMLSRQYDLRGPRQVNECRELYRLGSLKSGDCSTAMVLGSSLIMDPSMTLDMSALGILAPDGRCKTFDTLADGFARAEAVNAILIKPLEAAIRDGDPIRAVIRSTAVNSDGKTPHVGTPSTEAQRSLILRAYQSAGIGDLSKTPFVECHGTGTMKGDPIETTAVGKAFGTWGTYIGSVKPNLGHGEGAAALTSVIKCVLALENKTIPPNVNFVTPNPRIPFEEYNLQVPVEPVPWPEDRCQRISINSFGFGGANGHVILDSAASFAAYCGAARQRYSSSDNDSLEHGLSHSDEDFLSLSLPASISSQSSDCDSAVPEEFPRIVVLSARSEESIKRRIAAFEAYMTNSPSAINDIAYTLGMRAAHMSHRAFAIHHNDIHQSLQFSVGKRIITGREKETKVAFIFTGQGAQWPGMGRELVHSSATFREDIRNMDKVLQSLPAAPKWTLEDVLCRDDEAEALSCHIAELAQPLCTAVQVALVNFLSKCGIKPSAVIGHSSGEIAAAYAAGAIDYSEAILCSYFRGLVTTKLQSDGSMAAIGLGRDHVTPHLVDGAQIACENSPKSVSISGNSEAVRKTMENIEAVNKDTFMRKLKVQVAYHSPQMSPVATKYEEMMKPYHTGTKVLFFSAARQLLDDLPEITAMVEIGPHPALQGPVRQIIESKSPQPSVTYLGTLVRDKPAHDAVLTTLGRLYTMGHDIDFSFLNPGGSVVADLPRYSWDHKQDAWIESRLSKNWRMRQFAHHELLGTRCTTPSEFDATWRNMFRHYDIPWLKDHMLNSDIVFPAAGYVAMMGEAIRQFLGSEAYILEDVLVKATLIVPDAEPVEIVTTMRPFRLSGLSNSSTWYELSICSLCADTWVEHCVARGKAMSESGNGNSKQTTMAPLQRQVNEDYFYNRLQYLGFCYGPHFRRLRELTADTDRQHAVGAATDTTNKNEAFYALHPTSIDLALQLSALAACQGIGRRLDILAVPVELKHIMVCPGGPELVLDAVTDTDNNTASILAMSKDTGKTAVEIRDSRFIPFNNGGLQKQEPLHAAHMEWLPDLHLYDKIDFVRTNRNSRKFNKALDHATAVYVVQMLHELDSLGIDAATTPGDLPKYIAWLREEENKYTQDEELASLVSLSFKARTEMLDSLWRQVQGDVDETSLALVKMYARLATSENIAAIFTGSIKPLQICLDDKGLESFYVYGQSLVSPRDFLRLCTHSKPTLSVLEIGAGMGATTEAMLQGLVAEDGRRLYSKYVFTDISSGFFVLARDKFAKWDGVKYQVLDIESDPAAQGFELQSFDLIVASNGLLPGWWAEKEDSREAGPLVSVERWNTELLSAGFSGTDIVKLDDEHPYSITAHMASTALAEVKEPLGLTFLYRQARHEFACKLSEKLRLLGHQVQWVQLASASEENDTKAESTYCDIISTIELEGSSFMDEISEADYGHMMKLLARHKQGILWLTRPAQFACEAPGYGATTGLMRCARTELGLDCWTAEIEDLDDTALDSVFALSRKFYQRAPMDQGVDAEYAVRRDGVVYVPRFRWKSTEKELQQLSGDDVTKQLVIGQHGSVDTLHWIAHTEHLDLAPDEVEVDIRFVGLNFKDLLTTMGIVHGHKDSLGLECSGVVTRKGSAVDTVNVGDRVCAMGSGLMRTRKCFPSKVIIQIPDDMSLEQAATLPVVYATVVHAIVNIGRLRKGQSILIHSAAGGVGQAAIYMSRAIGAEVYVTAGTEEKVQFLMEKHQIPRNHIFDSRSDRFLDGVMGITDGRGVDLVLNSLAGDLLQASWCCVAKQGKMLEIGKRDILEHGRLAMDMFQGNRTYCGIDLSAMDEEQVTELINQCFDLRYKQHLKPIEPVQTFGPDQISEALKLMKKGHHMGKLVIAIPENGSKIPAKVSDKSKLFSDKPTYLLVGGLGGLGREVARWMIEKGAKSLCFLSPSAGSNQHAAFIKELESQGCRITAIAGDVSEMQDVERAISTSPSPIGGVMQISMVLRDCALIETTYQDWKAVQNPKVKGTWNLHRALINTKLDFFILFSSIAGLLGHPGQGSYASANAFLDSYCHYRQGLGLPCSVIDLGGVDGIGALAGKSNKISQFNSLGLFLLQEQHVIEAIEIALHTSAPTSLTVLPGPVGGFTWKPQIAIGLASARASSIPKNLHLFKADMRLGEYVNLAVDEDQREVKREAMLREALDQVEADPSVLDAPGTLDRLSLAVGSTLFEYLSLSEDEMDIHAPLESIGVDSLVSIEIRNWWRRTIGLEITASEIVKAGSIQGLGKLLVTGLKTKYTKGSDLPSDAANNASS